MRRAFTVAAALCLALAGCGYGPRSSEKWAELFKGQRLDQARSALDNPSGDERRWAIIRLSRGGNTADAALMRERLDPKTEKSPVIRATAIGAIRILGDRSMVPEIAECMGDPDATVRAEAVRTVGYLGVASDAPGLIRSLFADPAPAVRVEAAYALLRIKAVDAVPALAAALDDRDESVVFATHYALRELTQRDLPPYKDYWAPARSVKQ